MLVLFFSFVRLDLFLFRIHHTWWAKARILNFLISIFLVLFFSFLLCKDGLFIFKDFFLLLSCCSASGFSTEKLIIIFCLCFYLLLVARDGKRVSDVKIVKKKKKENRDWGVFPSSSVFYSFVCFFFFFFFLFLFCSNALVLFLSNLIPATGNNFTQKQGKFLFSNTIKIST